MERCKEALVFLAKCLEVAVEPIERFCVLLKTCPIDDFTQVPSEQTQKSGKSMLL